MNNTETYFQAFNISSGTADMPTKLIMESFVGIFYEAGKISLAQEFICNLVELSTKLHAAEGVVLAGILYEGKAAYPFEAGCGIIKTNFQEKWKIRPAVTTMRDSCDCEDEYH